MVKGISEVSAIQMQQLSNTTDLVTQIQSNLNQTWDIGNEKMAEALGKFVSPPHACEASFADLPRQVW